MTERVDFLFDRLDGIPNLEYKSRGASDTGGTVYITLESGEVDHHELPQGWRIEGVRNKVEGVHIAFYDTEGRGERMREGM